MYYQSNNYQEVQQELTPAPGGGGLVRLITAIYPSQMSRHVEIAETCMPPAMNVAVPILIRSLRFAAYHIQ